MIDTPKPLLEQADLAAGDTPPVFDTLDTFLDWDQDFYSMEEQEFYALAVARMLELLRAEPGGVILDAGCGVGTHSIRAAQAGYRVHALDFSSPALAEAARRARTAGLEDRITFEHADLTRLHLPDASFSRIFCWGVLIHIPAIEPALDELARILKPGGRLALYITNGAALDFRLAALARKLHGHSRVRPERHAIGEGYWYRERHGDIWVWQFDVAALTAHLARQGLCPVHRLPGMLTELHTRCPPWLRKPLVRLNTLWFRRQLSPHPAEANLLIFEKSERLDAAGADLIP